MTDTLVHTRRRFLSSFAVTCGSAALVRGSSPLPRLALERDSSDQEDKKNRAEEEVGPAEDLMREHGVLRRILLIYREAIRRTAARQQVPAEPLSQAATLVRRFVEDYHEKLEEEQVFPRFRKSNNLVPLVNVLYEQHQKGRILTGTILKLATPAFVKDPAELSKLSESLSRFIRMYEPHAAREDTVLFPAFRKIVSSRELDQLGDQFEKKENELFGQEGFEKNVEEVANLERDFGIYNLSDFTPKI